MCFYCSWWPGPTIDDSCAPVGIVTMLPLIAAAATAFRAVAAACPPDPLDTFFRGEALSDLGVREPPLAGVELTNDSSMISPLTPYEDTPWGDAAAPGRGNGGTLIPGFISDASGGFGRD
jgi:hypothetical protein